jgi:hypothetical protein
VYGSQINNKSAAQHYSFLLFKKQSTKPRFHVIDSPTRLSLFLERHWSASPHSSKMKIRPWNWRFQPNMVHFGALVLLLAIKTLMMLAETSSNLPSSVPVESVQATHNFPVQIVSKEKGNNQILSSTNDSLLGKKRSETAHPVARNNGRSYDGQPKTTKNSKSPGANRQVPAVK